MENYEVNPIELTEETADIYAEAIENGTYEDDFYATCDGRMVTIINPAENSNYKYYLRTVDGRYLSEVKTVDECIKFLLYGEYTDCWDGNTKTWKH